MRLLRSKKKGISKKNTSLSPLMFIGGFAKSGYIEQKLGSLEDMNFFQLTYNRQRLRYYQGLPAATFDNATTKCLLFEFNATTLPVENNCQVTYPSLIVKIWISMNFLTVFPTILV